VTLINERSGWRLDLSTHGILCVAFTPDSRSFVTGHSDGIVRRWDSETGGLISSLKGCSDAVWSIDVMETTAGDSHVAGGARDGSVVAWELSSGDEIARLPPSESCVSCLRWSPSGDALAISCGDFSDRQQNSLMVWSLLDHHSLVQAPVDKPIAALQWLANEEGLLIANWKGDTTLWQPGFDAPRPTAPLGDGGKQRAEAANWSADCPLFVATPSIN
jgi:WD40 repeat protein